MSDRNNLQTQNPAQRQQNHPDERQQANQIRIFRSMANE
jgi:hypothetical protein